MKVAFLLIFILTTTTHAFKRRSRSESHRAYQGRNTHTMVSPTSGTPSFYLSVLDYGAQASNCSSGNNPTPYFDNTPKFQAALDDAGVRKGAVVQVPAGCYFFSGVLSIPKAVTLEGTSMSVAAHSHVLPQDGVVFFVKSGKGDESSPPFLSMVDNTVVRGIVFYYPDQDPHAAPIPFPYTIAMTGNNPAVYDVELLNSFNGIYANGAARHYIARVQGQPSNVGLYIDSTYDIGRVEDVHWNPWYSDDIKYMAWQLTYGRAFVFGRSDWEYVLNTFAFGYAVGYHFIQTPTGTMNGNLLGIGADLMYNASVLVDASQAPGLLITNGEFTAFHSDEWMPGGPRMQQVHVTAGNTGPVKFVDCSFWGPTDAIATLEGSGTTTFSSCEFVQWDLAYNNGTAAIRALGGNLILQGNTFAETSDKAQIEFGPSFGRGVISGNMFDAPQKWLGRQTGWTAGTNSFP